MKKKWKRRQKLRLRLRLRLKRAAKQDASPKCCATNFDALAKHLTHTHTHLDIDIEMCACVCITIKMPSTTWCTLLGRWEDGMSLGHCHKWRCDDVDAAVDWHKARRCAEFSSLLAARSSQLAACIYFRRPSNKLATLECCSAMNAHVYPQIMTECLQLAIGHFGIETAAQSTCLNSCGFANNHLAKQKAKTHKLSTRLLQRII